jgi:hypothetical protein
MDLWTTFTPGKTSWELTAVATNGKKPSRDWIKNIEIIKVSLQKLAEAGISGVRLVIYPSELTADGKSFEWTPIEKVLEICRKSNLNTDLCIGPFQYPNYPGIFLPAELINSVPDNIKFIDDVNELTDYGLFFLKKQIEKFGSDKRVRGFHLGNEWPDMQKVEGKRTVRAGVSENFMLNALELLKSNTQKPILLNTNIPIYNKRQIINVFGKILHTLSDRGKLGFDIYPTQDKWKKDPFVKFMNSILDLPGAFADLQGSLPDTELYFAEVEAQPWGSGQSWFRMISEEEAPGLKILNYFNDSLVKTFEKYISGSGCKSVSLWGADFWLASDMMNIKWPLNNVRTIKKAFV